MRNSFLRRVGLILIAAAMLLFSGCGAQSTAEEIKYKATFLDLFDTVTQIIGYDTEKAFFETFADHWKDELATYHALYDIYHDDAVTSIKTINDNAGIQAVTVDSRIIDLLLLSREMYDLTGGKTNVAMGAVLSIWHDYREAGINDPENAELPPMDQLIQAAKHTNIEDMIIDTEASTVYLRDPAMSLDVGAIAKGYATERIAQNIAETGRTSVLLSVGGNVRAIGEKPDGTTWTVGVQNPDLDAEAETLFNLNINNLSVVTSGSYQRYYTVDGVRYNHIIDPDTLMPTTYFIGISVVTEDSGYADGLSTALFCMPLEQGRALVESMEGVEACWVAPDGTITMTEGFEALIQQ
ncbi:MAG TPA: FAD:protein FMN transferase [Candidatus Limiplasma sp.]|nr:FAD:protein FMN transferase [Candidatus Limiplasma sp.]HRX09244.1 FAD:protein FMN transferase [Candidatus Limiplasma sp.]